MEDPFCTIIPTVPKRPIKGPYWQFLHMPLTIEDLRKIRDQVAPDWLHLYATGLRPEVAERVRRVAEQLVRQAFRDDVVDDVLVNTYDRKALGGILLANWHEERDVLAYIAAHGFVLKKVLDSKRKLCRNDSETIPLGTAGEDSLAAPDPAAPPERAAPVVVRLVLREPERRITQPLIAAAMQFYDRIDWKVPEHADLRRAVEAAIGPPDPLKQLERVRATAVAAIQREIEGLAAQKLKARSLQTIRALDERLDQLHAKASVMPLTADHITSLMRVSPSNAYQLIARYTAQAEEFFIVVRGNPT